MMTRRREGQAGAAAPTAHEARRRAGGAIGAACLLAALCAAALFATSPADAQAAQNSAPGHVVPVPPSGSREAPAPVPPANPPDGGSGSTVPQGSTSDSLSRSGGVIRPPGDVDPKMHQPPPNAGSSEMPVIPPPGSPGGDPTVKPK